MAENLSPKELTDADFSGGNEDKGSTPTASVPTASRSEYHSTRIESMLTSRSEFETELEYWTAHSRVHWSELSHHERASSCEESLGSGSGDAVIDCGHQSVVDHRQHFEKLQKDAIWGGFCNTVADVVLGKKLGEGAQAVIYEALNVTFATELSRIYEEGGKNYGYVVKVMKSSTALEDLHRQWPRGLATLDDSTVARPEFHLYGALVKDHAVGRNQFGFVMPKFWGDLRRLIDLRMERNKAQGPPFPTLQARWAVFFIANQIQNLHKRGIIHRDLKAANVLLNSTRDVENCDLVHSNDSVAFSPYVADWECSVGVIGTGFWRAPELLQQLKNKTLPSSEIVFTEEMDVYSFAMTCYEIATGKLPFEGLSFNYETRDAILDGLRPKLPEDMDPSMKAIIRRCWDPNPSNRLSFDNILKITAKIW